MNTTNVLDAFVPLNQPDTADNKAGEKADMRRVVVAPSLWAPFHHVAAIESLAAFIGTVRPHGVVFMNASGEMSDQTRVAFTEVIAGFRAGYTGRIGVHGYGEHDTGALASLRVTVVADLAPIVPGWLAAPGDLTTRRDVITCAESTGANLVCGTTGRFRLTGRARPAADGGVRAWLVFECGTLAADPAAGTLGFGVLEGSGRAACARPIRVGADGGFIFHGTRYTAPARANLAGDTAPTLTAEHTLARPGATGQQRPRHALS